MKKRIVVIPWDLEDTGECIKVGDLVLLRYKFYIVEEPIHGYNSTTWKPTRLRAITRWEQFKWVTLRDFW